MSKPQKRHARREAKEQSRATSTPVSNLWAELLPSEPDLDDLDLSPLPAKGPRTSPALTAGSLELPVSARSPSGPQLVSSAPELEPLSPAEEASEGVISNEFNSFEALDEGISEARREELKRESEERRAQEQAEAQAREDLDAHSSAERFGELSLTPEVTRGSWFLRFSRVWSGATMMLLAALLVEICTSTPLLEITELELELQGSHVTQQRVEGLLREEGGPHNILTFDHERFEVRLEELPWVRRAEVIRSFPRKLTVKLQEHQATGVVVFRRLYAVNSRGELLAPIKPSQATSLPLVSGVPQELFSSPEGAEVGRYLIRRGLRIAALYQELELDLLRSLSEVHVSETGYVELILNKTRVSLGKEDFDRHLEDLRELLLALKRKGVDAQYILLSSDFTRAIVKEGPLRVTEQETGG